VKCWICKRQARGFGHIDGRFTIADPRRYPRDWVFCSRRCQDLFHRLYGHWVEVGPSGKEIAMVDATPLEKAALRRCLKFFGEAASVIGFDKPLGAYSEAEALSVVDAIVTAYVDEMAAQHERSKYPPVRMPGATPVNDPIREAASAEAADPFATMADDLPWEAR
jgi:hypothetical protein